MSRHYIVAVQIGYEIIRVTFMSDAAFKAAKALTGVHLFGMWFRILGGGPPTTLVHIFDYPYDEDHVEIEFALSDDVSLLV